MKNVLKKYWPFIVLLSIDLVLIVLHLVNFWRPFGKYHAFYMEGDDSYAEHFQNTKWVVMIVISVMTVLKRKDKNYYSWTLVFVFLFLEDVFRIHQSITSFISQNILGGITTRQWKILEMLVAATIGIIIIVPLIRSYKKGGAIFRRQSKALVALLILLVFFGIVMDQAHRLYFVGSHWKMEFIAGVIEDGGEMITASYILGYLAIIYFNSRAPQKASKSILS